MPYGKDQAARMGMGENIRARRKELGLTLRQLAKEAGCTASFLCDVEHGKRRIGADLLLAVCSALGLPMQATMTGTTEPHRPGASVPALPQKLLAWLAGTDVPFRQALALYAMWRVAENYRTRGRERDEENFDWPRFYEAVREFL
jgi:transcriptional regulator with XRE-family HTH domain